MQPLHVTGRLSMVATSASGEPRHVIEIEAEADAIRIDLDSLQGLFAIRGLVDRFGGAASISPLLSQSLAVHVKRQLVARSHHGRRSGILSRALGLGPIRLVWGGLVRSLFAPANPRA